MHACMLMKQRPCKDGNYLVSTAGSELGHDTGCGEGDYPEDLLFSNVEICNDGTNCRSQLLCLSALQ